MLDKLLWVVRAVDLNVRPYHKELGAYNQLQFIGACEVDCHCGARHVYDLYVDFDKTMRGGWRPHVLAQSEMGLSDARYGNVSDGHAEAMPLKAAEEIVRDLWWTIYTRVPQTDKV